MEGSPFKFLDSFTKEDKEIFFGRDREVEEIFSRVFQSKTMLVYGASGTGKTSLIQCGLANKFNDADWMPILVRRGSNMLESIKSALSQRVITPLKDKGSLSTWIKSLYLDHFKPIYFIFDQFEELFIFGSDEEIQDFVQQVGKILKTDLAVKFIFVIRGEYLEYLSDFEEHIPDFFDNRIRIEKMTRKNATEAILGPCRVFNIEVEPDFASNLLEKLNPDKTEVELTYLQVFLDKIYKKSSADSNGGKIRFTTSLLDSLGHISDVLSDFLEEQIAKIPDSENALSVLKSFVSTEGTKRQVNVAEISEFTRALGKNLSAESLESFILQFVNLRILRDKDEQDKYELRHDSLAAKIYEKITLVEKELIEVRNMLMGRFKEFERREVLLTIDDLNYIAPYEEKLFLNPELKTFVDNSRWEIGKARRRRRQLLAAAAIILILIMSGFTYWALNERGKAVEQQKIAEVLTVEALKAKDEALVANQAAIEAKEKAENMALQALQAKTSAERSKMEAILQQSIAVSQSERAELLRIEAEKQTGKAVSEASKAEKQRLISEDEKSKAETAQRQATNLSYQSLAQKLALKATLESGDPQLQGLLASAAYSFNSIGKGRENDPSIFKGLTKAMSSIYRKDYNLFTPVSSNESKILSFNSSGLLYSLGNSGLISFWDLNTKKLIRSEQLSLKNLSPPSFWANSSSGKMIVSGHDDFSINLWSTRDSSGFTRIGFPIVHSGLIRGAVFLSAKTLVTGGKDGKVVKWRIESSGVLEKQIQMEAEVIALEAAGNFIAYALKNGKSGLLSEKLELISLPEQSGGSVTNLFYDKKGRLYAATSSGSILVYEISSSARFLRSIPASKSPIKQMVVDANAKFLYAVDNEKVIFVFDLNNLNLDPLKISDSPSMIRSIAATDKKVFIGFADSQIRAWEIESDVLQSKVCSKITRSLTEKEWATFIGDDIKTRNVCVNE